MKRQLIALTVLTTLCAAHVASADIFIDIHDASISAGEDGFVDVTMTVDNDTLLSNYSLKFRIDTPYPPSDSALVFVEDSLDYATAMNPDYVFRSMSGNLAGDAGNGGLPSHDWWVSDLADPSAAVLLPDTIYLLARLKVQHSYNLTDIDPSGHAFTVSLVAGSDTLFSDDRGNPLGYHPSSASGVVTVPEPGSLLLMLAGLSVWAACALFGEYRSTHLASASERLPAKDR